MNYLRKLFSTGAVRETPPKVLAYIAAKVPVADNALIIEVGAGKGEITKYILSKTTGSQRVNYHAFEIDEHACTHLKQTFSNIHVWHKSAFEFRHVLPPNALVNSFVSSIPLSFYKRSVLESFFSSVTNNLADNGIVLIVFSAPWLIGFLKRQLPGFQVQSFFTFPLYFVGVYKKA